MSVLLHVCLCITRIPSAYAGQKRQESDPLQLELQLIVNLTLVTEDQILIFWSF